MDTETAEVVERINARIDTLEVSLRAEIRESLTEAKRYALVLHQSVRDDIRMVGEAVATVGTKLDSLQR
jgi:hypothetical protein